MTMPSSQNPSLVEAMQEMLHNSVASLEAWPTVEAFKSWAAGFDPSAVNGVHAMEVLTRWNRPDLIGWAASPDNPLRASPDDWVRTLFILLETNDVASSQALLAARATEALRHPSFATGVKDRDLFDPEAHPVATKAYAVMVLAQTLLDEGLDVNLSDRFGRTLLMAAVSMRSSPWLLSRLLVAGAAIEATDYRGNSALNIAAFSGNVAAIRTLLDAGANVAHVNQSGRNVLMQSVSNPDLFEPGKLDLLLPLLDPHALDDHGDTVLDDAMKTLFDTTPVESEHHNHRVHDACRLTLVMRPDVVRSVLQRFTNPEDPIRRQRHGVIALATNWLQDATEREASALRNVLDVVPHEDHAPSLPPRRRM